MQLFRVSSSAITTAFIAGIVLGCAGTGIAATVLGSSVFDDVKVGSYYDAAVGDMYSIGVIKGYDSDHFGPDDYVTRGQVAVMMQRLKNDVNGISNDDTASATSSRSRASSVSSKASSTSSTAPINNPKGTFRFTTNAYSVSETLASVTISVVRVGGNQGEVAVSYAVTANTATAGSDFETVNGTLTFAAKETSKTFTITIKDDSVNESNETATITLSAPTNGAIIGTPATATLTILDNESASTSAGTTNTSSSTNPNGTFSLGGATYALEEDAGTLTVRVYRTGGTTGSVNVNYATSNGTGAAGDEYTAANGTLNFAGGETSKTFTVSILDDISVDGGKTFNLTLSTPTGGANLGTPATSVVTIMDDENETAFGSGSLKFKYASMDVSESSGKADVIVMRGGGTVGTVTVDYATANGSALSGSDYTSTSGTLTFAPGESSKIIVVPVTKDSTSDSEEVFRVSLSNASNNVPIIVPSTIEVNLFD